MVADQAVTAATPIPSVQYNKRIKSTRPFYQHLPPQLKEGGATRRQTNVSCVGRPKGIRVRAKISTSFDAMQKDEEATQTGVYHPGAELEPNQRNLNFRLFLTTLSTRQELLSLTIDAAR